MATWIMMGLAAAAAMILRLLEAKSEEEAEQALMQGAEAIKAALDAKKFGTPPT
jgi:hypothetical protein